MIVVSLTLSVRETRLGLGSPWFLATFCANVLLDDVYIRMPNEVDLIAIQNQSLLSSSPDQRQNIQTISRSNQILQSSNLP